ncbi:MAG: phosphonate C-P lyase system protein PhnL [Desulfobacterota bacterium]|nr:phosphonate C-P lyase system protein PhnL [Thermodesulfobacteriota bacterium]
MDLRLRAERVIKTFVLHLQGGLNLPVLKGVDLEVGAGECVALCGPSGIGKSTLLRILYGNYQPNDGKVWVYHRENWVDLFRAEPWQVYDIRKHTLGYVSQFLRVIPRVPAVDVVAEPLWRAGATKEEGRHQAMVLLRRLNLPERLWNVSPTTFSGGEQQRVNLARGFIFPYPILLLDEPTASLDETNRRIVVQFIEEAKARGAAIVGVFHDREVREAVSTRRVMVDEGIWS